MPLTITSEFSSEGFVGPTALVLHPREIAKRYAWSWCQIIPRKLRWENSDVLPLVTVSREIILFHGVHNASPSTWYQQQRAPARDPSTGPLFVASTVAVATPSLFSVAIMFRHSSASRSLWLHYRVLDRDIFTIPWPDLSDEEKALIIRALKKPVLEPFKGGLDYTRRAGKLRYNYPLENRGK